MKKAEQKKSVLKKLKEKELVETKSALKKFAKQFNSQLMEKLVLIQNPFSMQQK